MLEVVVGVTPAVVVAAVVVMVFAAAFEYTGPDLGMFGPLSCNLLKPNDIYIYMSCRSANLQTLYFKYSTNIHTLYFKHAA